MNEHHRKSRVWLAVLTAVAAALCLGAAGTILSFAREAAWAEAPLAKIEVALGVFLLLGGATLFGAVAVDRARAPAARPPRVLRSEEWESLFAVAMGAALLDLLALRTLALLGGDLSAASLPAKLGFALLAAAGASLTLGLVRGICVLLYRGTSRLFLPGVPLVAGRPLACQLEIPFAADAAPEIEATLSLQRAGESTGDSSPGITETLWSKSAVLATWEPRGARRCRAALRFALPLPDAGLAFGPVCWQLAVRSISGSPAFYASFTLPIAIRDPVAEGLVALA